MAHFLPAAAAGKKPGFPLQFLATADAVAAGFPLLSLAQGGCSEPSQVIA
jgi:hypothetical protein